MDIKKPDSNQNNNNNEDDEVVALQGKESKLSLDKTKLGWNLATNDLSKSGKMSSYSYWIDDDNDDDEDSEFDIEVEINEDKNINLDIKKEELAEIIKPKK